MTTSKQDVESMFRRLCRCADAARINASEWALIEGSASNGRPWRLYRVDPLTGGQYTAFGGDSLLGHTRREAWLTLYGMARGFEAVVDAQEATAPL